MQIIKSKKRSHEATIGKNKINGTTTSAPSISNANGKKRILRITVQRRFATSCLADRSAASGVISGKLTIYSANNEALMRYRLNVVKKRKIADHTNVSTNEDVKPVEADELKSEPPMIIGDSCTAIIMSMNTNGISGYMPR